MQAGISVYCPHTALDSVKGGINDWLAKAFGPSEVVYITDKNDDAGGVGRKVTLPEPGISIQEVVANIKKHLQLQHGQFIRTETNQPNLTLLVSVQVAQPYEQNQSNKKIRTIAICAGSGASVFQGVDADLYFTGEMQHVSLFFFSPKRYINQASFSMKFWQLSRWTDLWCCVRSCHLLFLFGK